MFWNPSTKWLEPTAGSNPERVAVPASTPSPSPPPAGHEVNWSVAIAAIPLGQRAINSVLDKYVDGWERKAVHESSASHDYVQRYCSRYSRSFYFEDVPRGGCAVSGELCQDLQTLTFADASIDVFITQDVFEHILDPAAAAREIARVLVPGGVHVFTAPKYMTIERSFPRIVVDEGGITHTHPPEYHGNPVGDGRALVTWIYGRDFESVLTGWGGQTTTTYVTRYRQLGLDGEHLEVFVTRKANGQ